jgi:hypothetical protein
VRTAVNADVVDQYQTLEVSNIVSQIIMFILIEWLHRGKRNNVEV